MNWYYVDGPQRVGPVSENDWRELVRSGKIVPETLVWHEDLAGWTPFGQLTPPPLPLEEEPEEESDPVSSASLSEEDPDAYAARIVDLDYPVRLGGSIRDAWRLLNGHFWMLVGSTLLAYALMFVGGNIRVLDMLMAFALNGVVTGGLYSVYLRLMRGENAAPADLFSGFESGVFRNLALKTMIASLVMIACFIPVGIAFVATGLEPGVTPENIDPIAMVALLLTALACMIPAFYFGFCWIFAIPLIIDKRMHFGAAMRLSRRKVLQHPWRVSVLVTVAGLVAVLPGLVVAVGLGVSGLAGTEAGMTRLAVISMLAMMFTAPIYIGALLFLYEDMFNPSPLKPEGKPSREPSSAASGPARESDTPR